MARCLHAHAQDVCPSAGGEGGGHGVKRGRGGSGAGGNRTTWHGFDLCIGDGTVYEGALCVRVPWDQVAFMPAQHDTA